MTATATATTRTRSAPSRPASWLRVFAALVRRDAQVTRGELGTLIAQGVVMPFLLLYVFGKIIATMGFVDDSYAEVLFPGLIAMVTFAAALQSSAMPLVIDFATGREIEDRLMAPVPTALIAVEKIVFAALRAMFCAVIMVPIGFLALGGLPYPASGIPLAVAATVVGSLVSAAFGITLGTALPPQRISAMYAMVLVPLMFTGSAQYPWPMIDGILWFQILSLFNPMTYFSEVMRAALVPDAVEHLNPWLSMGLLLATMVIFGALAIRGFCRRAVA
ncbi:MAG TPA: ABC transporter permease [Micromonosporaceae bacterium]|nr:ABC transporter permease [Micromonosporaceae bacterium]